MKTPRSNEFIRYGAVMNKFVTTWSLRGCSFEKRRHMRKIFLILALFIIIPEPSLASSAASQATQDTPPLTLKQIEQLIESGIDDEVIAREIGERGLAFRLPAGTLEHLIRRGAGEQTRRALLLQEERAA